MAFYLYFSRTLNAAFILKEGPTFPLGSPAAQASNTPLSKMSAHGLTESNFLLLSALLLSGSARHAHLGALLAPHNNLS